jgi:uncharacterized protein YlaI
VKIKRSKIRESAHMEDCTLRIPGVCNFNPETTVLAHVGKHHSAKRLHNDEAVYACHDCHDAIDFRTKVFLSDNKATQLMLHKVREGLIEDAQEATKQRLREKGIIK